MDEVPSTADGKETGALEIANETSGAQHGQSDGTLDMLANLVAAEGPVPEIERYIRRPAPPLLVVLTGPSGVGKDVTLERMRR